MSLRVLAVDPGLDEIGLALLVPPAGPVAFNAAVAEVRVPWLQWAGKIATDDRERMPARLADLHARVVDRAHMLDVTHAIVELPARAGGGYKSQAGSGGHARNARAMGSYHMALGVILAALEGAGVNVTTRPASTTPKPRRHARVKQLLAGTRWAGIRHRDTLCAVWVALHDDLGVDLATGASA